MTTYTPLGVRHAYNRKKNFNPRIRLREYLKGNGNPRKFEMEAVARSRKKDKVRHLSEEVNELNSKSQVENILKSLSPEAHRVLSIIDWRDRRKMKTDYKRLKKKLGKKGGEKARKAVNELKKLDLVYSFRDYSDEQYISSGKPPLICCIDEGIQPELELII